ncbi:MAG: hypothetical protein HS130_02415 [Deltaproteobacteria bacterium]|nr:hypothetical protein [Deltaproteobacteria bacterium]MCL4873582.1 hypothetical protein [bacterium]
MPKYGRGLGREIVGAVNRGDLKEPFNVALVRAFAKSKNWEVPENYLLVCLANASNESHSLNFKKYFESIGDGLYRIREEYKGSE